MIEFEFRFLGFLIPGLMFLLALYFFSGRGTFLISGYNTLPKEDQERYNVKALTQATGIFTVVLAGLMTFILYMGFFGNTMWSLVGIICVFVFTGLWLLYMAKSKKFKTDND
jgi:hypothetical protein